MIRVVPGLGELELWHLLLDLNGTTTSWGEIDPGVPERLRRGAKGCVAIGNGVNDAAMLKTARIGIAVLGGEGLATSALQAADVLCGSMTEALDLLLNQSGLAATLRP